MEARHYPERRIEWAKSSTLGRRLVVILLTVMAGSNTALVQESAIRRDATVRAIENVLPSVVNIATATIVQEQDPYERLLQQFYGPYYQRRRPSAQFSRGSGLIIDESGYVLTNHHVVQNADHIWITLQDREEPIEAVLMYRTKESDLALLKLRSDDKFQVAAFAAPDDLLLGETVIALGNPFGLGGSVSRGILSSKARQPDEEIGPMDVANWLQTDAAINPGNSGGPLINLNGEVVGINIAVLREGQGISFAIPIRRVLQALGEVITPALEGLWFGARVRPGKSPLFVSTIVPNSPAAQAGLKRGDLILAINNTPPKNFIELNRLLIGLGTRQPGTIKYQRGDQVMEKKIQLVAESDFFNAKLIQAKTGASVQALNKELADGLRIQTTHGLIVAGVDEEDPARRAKMDRGFIIVSLDGEPVNDIVTMARRLHEKSTGDWVTLEVITEHIRRNFRQIRTGTIRLQVR